MNAIAYCGLVCCICSENKDCIGCQNGGCDIRGWCKNYNCCKEKGLNGCWECTEFPCAGSMLDSPVFVLLRSLRNGTAQTNWKNVSSEIRRKALYITMKVSW